MHTELPSRHAHAQVDWQPIWKATSNDPEYLSDERKQLCSPISVTKSPYTKQLLEATRHTSKYQSSSTKLKAAAERVRARMD